VDKEGKGQVGTPQKSVFHQQHPAAARSTGHIGEIQGTSDLRKERMLPACHVQPENEQLPQGNRRFLRHKEKSDHAPRKTLRILFLTKIQHLTKLFSLIGNDLETSEVLIFATSCINQKNALSEYKDTISFLNLSIICSKIREIILFEKCNS